MLSSSSSHAVAVTEKGAAFGWGSTASNQLGQQSVSYLDTPTLLQVSNSQPPLPLASASCGTKHTLFLTQSGQIVQWDDAGEMVWRSPFATVIVQITCGSFHSLLVDSDGKLLGFGSNMHGQLGLGDFLPRNVPTQVRDVPMGAVVGVAAGERHSLCITNFGDCFAFGFNEQGQLGLGHTLGEPSPRLVVALEGKAVVNAQCGAWHSGALTEDGQLFLFGSGSFGKLGNGSEADILLPLRENEFLVDKQSPIASFSLGETHSACVLEDGRLFVWGSESRGHNSLFPEERKVSGGVKFSQVHCSAGLQRTLAVEKDTGKLFAWSAAHGGKDTATVLIVPRIGATTFEQVPKPLVSKFAVRQLSTGTGHVLLLTNNGLVYSFGTNNEGQCGMQRANALVPQQVKLDSRIATLACGFNHSLLVTLGGDMLEFGRNKFAPQPVRCEDKVDKVATGENHSACVTRDGQLLTWGQTSMGKLGLGPLDRSFVSTPTPVLFSTLDIFTHTVVDLVSCSRDHTLAVSNQGQLFGFGLLAGREIVEEPRALLVGETCVSASAGEMHSICVTANGDVFRSSSRDNFVKLGQQALQAVACADGRTLLLHADGKSLFVVERNETIGRWQVAGVGEDLTANLCQGAAIGRDGSMYVWLGNKDFKASLIAPLASPVSLNSLQAVQIKDALHQVQEFKLAFAQLPGTVRVPIAAIQVLLRHEARRVSEFSDAALRDQILHTKLWDRKNLEQLAAVKQRERDVLSPLEISCQFAVQYCARVVAEQDTNTIFHASHFSTPSAKLLLPKRPQDQLDSTRPVLPMHLIAAIPVLETILGLLLVNPGYMFALYKRRLASQDVFAGLCRDLYSGADVHSEHLFTLLVLRIAREEITNDQDTFEHFTTRAGLFFPMLFDLIPIKYQQLQARIRSIIRKELLILRNEQYGDMQANLSKMFLEVFQEQIMGDLVLRHFRNVAQLFSGLHSLLLDVFGLGQGEAVALWTCQFMAQRLFLPVLFEQCTRENWLELYYAMDKLLQQSLKPVQQAVKRTSNFEQTLSRYHGLVRGNLPLKERIELDQALIEATTSSRKRDFVLKFEDVASKFRLLHAGEATAATAPGAADARPNSATTDTETSVKVRAAGLELVRRELALVDQHDLETELVFDLIREEIRFAPLVVFATRRTLEYVQYAVEQLAKEEVLSQTNEWKFLLGSCRDARRELKGRWDVDPALDVFDDMVGTAMRLDMSSSSWFRDRRHQGEGWTSCFVLDSVTLAPIPARFVVAGEQQEHQGGVSGDENQDVLGMRQLEQILDHSPALREFRASFVNLSSTFVGDEVFTQQSFQLVREMEGRAKLLQTSLSVQLLQEALSLEIAAASRVLNEQIAQLEAYSSVLRHGDRTKHRLEEVAKRKLGQEFVLTDFHFIRTVQLGAARPTPRRMWWLSSCTRQLVDSSVPPSSPQQEAAMWKHQLSDHGLVRGAFGSYSYHTLAARRVVLMREGGDAFGLGNAAHNCAGSGGEAGPTSTAFEQLFTSDSSNNHSALLPPSSSSCPFEPGHLAQTWSKLVPKLVFHLHLSSAAKLFIKLTYDTSAVLAFVEVDIFQVVNFSKTCTLDWFPPTFPVCFRVRALLFLVQEMVLKSFM
ncbi:hypothetical protein BASA81_008541 [Batrachochytrium salamandrivorans]|nr:hypothetical protein BASA81_008541 [Batrachochytrium salamandrivorans]